MQTGCLAVGMAVLTERAILWKNEAVRSIIHDGRRLGVLRGALFHGALSIVLTLIGVSMVRCWPQDARQRAECGACLSVAQRCPHDKAGLRLEQRAHMVRPGCARVWVSHLGSRACSHVGPAPAQSPLAPQVQWIAPPAAGAGVSLVIAYLNGNAVPDLLSWRALLVKWAGTICSVSANLTFGPEAPMVHLGACMAHIATHFVSSEAHPLTLPKGSHSRVCAATEDCVV